MMARIPYQNRMSKKRKLPSGVSYEIGISFASNHLKSLSESTIGGILPSKIHSTLYELATNLNFIPCKYIYGSPTPDALQRHAVQLVQLQCLSQQHFFASPSCIIPMSYFSHYHRSLLHCAPYSPSDD